MWLQNYKGECDERPQKSEACWWIEKMLEVWLLTCLSNKNKDTLQTGPRQNKASMESKGTLVQREKL